METTAIAVGIAEHRKQDASVGAHFRPNRGCLSWKFLQREAKKLRIQPPCAGKGKLNSIELVGQRVSLSPGRSLCCVLAVFSIQRKHAGWGYMGVCVTSTQEPPFYPAFAPCVLVTGSDTVFCLVLASGFVSHSRQKIGSHRGRGWW